jgi:hypothetical protein
MPAVEKEARLQPRAAARRVPHKTALHGSHAAGLLAIDTFHATRRSLVDAFAHPGQAQLWLNDANTRSAKRLDHTGLYAAGRPKDGSVSGTL